MYKSIQEAFLSSVSVHALDTDTFLAMLYLRCQNGCLPTGKAFSLSHVSSSVNMG